jgi:hypothetical protein
MSLILSSAENASTLSHLAHLWPEFLLAWAGWLVHSMVHSAGHLIKHTASKGMRLVVGYLKSR